jgi:GxxExxY protein
MFVNKEYPLSELTGKIIGCAMEVHKYLGTGFQEIIYQRRLEIEMNIQNIEYLREHEMEIYYKGSEIGRRRVDFLSRTKLWLN